MFLIIFTITLLSCQQLNQKSESEITRIQIEPYRVCSTGPKLITVENEVMNGLILDSVSGFPDSVTEIPQHSIDLNFKSNSILPENTRIDIYVNAQNNLGRIMIGHTWIPREHPPLNHWKQNVCFPVACPINMPISLKSRTWDINARIRVQNGDVTVINLGRVTLG